MVAIKAHQAQSVVDRLDPRISVVLVHGNDAGLVSELAQRAAKSIAGRSKPPAEILRIEDIDLDSDPDRLFVELQTMPMFGGGKVVRTTIGRRVNGPALKSAIENGPPAAALVVEAGQLKATDALRKFAESADFAAAIPCYGDSERDLAQIVSDMLASAGRTASSDTRELLVSRLGADRALSRGEIDKLILYVGDRTEITPEDVLAIVGDASELTLDRITLAAADGDAARAIRECERANAAGQGGQTILIALQRHFLVLHTLAAAIDAGRPVDAAMKQLRPPPHFSVRDALTRQLRIWRLATLDAALARIQAAVRDTRLESDLEAAMTERLMLELQRLSRRRT